MLGLDARVLASGKTSTSAFGRRLRAGSPAPKQAATSRPVQPSGSIRPRSPGRQTSQSPSSNPGPRATGRSVPMRNLAVPSYANPRVQPSLDPQVRTSQSNKKIAPVGNSKAIKSKDKLPKESKSKPDKPAKSLSESAVRRRAKKHAGTEISTDLERLLGFRPDVEVGDWKSTAPHTMVIGRHVVVPNGGAEKVSKYLRKGTGRWIKRLFREDFPILAIGTAAAMVGAVAFGLPDPSIGARLAVFQTSLAAAVAEESVLFPLAFAVTAIRRHRMYNSKGLRALGKGLQGTATRMAGLVTAKSLLGVTLHAGLIAGAVTAAGLFPLGATGAWVVGVGVGNVMATGVVLAASDLMERGINWAGRKGKSFGVRFVPGVSRAVQRRVEQEDARVRDAQSPGPGRSHADDVRRGDWQDHQEWRAINQALAMSDKVGGGSGKQHEEVAPHEAMTAMRRRLSDYRVSNYALMFALKAVVEDHEFGKLISQGNPAAVRLYNVISENENTPVTDAQREADEDVYHRRLAELEEWQEEDLSGNPFMKEIKRLMDEHEFLIGLADSVVDIAGNAGRHLSAAADVSPLRKREWSDAIKSLFPSSSNLFSKPTVQVVADPIELVREQVLTKYSPGQSEYALAG